jgi:glycosyltransferase involved in cell wall biosynthesis
MEGAPALDILQLITDRDRRGAQIFALDLGAGLRRLGVTVETVALAPGVHGDLLPVRTLGRRRLGFGALKELRRMARHYDVIVAHGSTTLPASVLALIDTGLPIVYRQVSDPEFWAASWRRRLRSAALLRRASAVVALSPGTSEALKRHYWLRSRPPVTVIPNAVSEERFRPPTPEEREKARTALGLPIDSDVLLFIGALASEKGVDLAILASSELPDAVLVIVGDGPLRPELEKLASRRMPGRSFFIGPLDDARLAYWSADALVFPSLSEAMPAVLIEAGLCGLASVATDVGAIGEVVDHGTTGFVVPSGDAQAIASALSTLMSDRERRSAMGRAAAERCSSRFTITHVASTWLELLSSVSATRHGRKTCDGDQ